MTGPRLRLAIFVVAGLTLVLLSCVPLFPVDGSATATALGPLVRLDWTAAAPNAEDDPVARYAIEVDGLEVASVDAPATACVVTGLTAGTTHDLAVTAYSSKNAWSGNNSTQGRLSTTYTPPAGGNGGPTLDCVDPTDSDADRLPDAVETDTGAYLGAGSTGTDPATTDTDADGIADGDEALGTTAGLFLPAFGVSPTHQDLLFEFDWFDDNAEPGTCGTHSHRPTAAVLARVQTTFANAPRANPDGTTGINVVGDYGQGGAFTGGNLIADADGVIAGGVNGTDFRALKAANFAANREGTFHYVLLPHRYNTTSTSSGQAELPGDDLVVSLYCFGSTNNVANTIVHEVGHNLGLRHGGNEDRNYKPNYNSVMNYKYQFPGVDTDCTPPGNGLLDYSSGSRASLDESALVEADGICGGVAVDWNGNAVIDAGTISRDINVGSNGLGDGLLSVLTDHDDWAVVSLSALDDADGAAPESLDQTEIVTEQPVPVEAQG